MSSRKVLVIGGTGYFGRLLIDDLLRNTDCDLTVSSRNCISSNRYETVVADLWAPDSLGRALPGLNIVKCTGGAFRALALTLADLCSRGGFHYIAVAARPRFVQQVRSQVSQ